jgi:hypothetical protein
LLRLEGSVRFGAVVGEAVDAVAGCGEGLVGVAEEADLGSAYHGGVSSAHMEGMSGITHILVSMPWGT